METDAHNTKGEIAPAMPEGARGLWQEAIMWVGWLFEMINPATLRTTGVSREHGARLSMWLNNIEGAVRRLILSAALAMTPPALRRAVNFMTKRKPASTTSKRLAFRIFRFAGPGAPPRAPEYRPWKPTPLKPYGHLVFRADPLLSLGDRRPPPPPLRRLAPRARNPLDRWVRRSPHAPDWLAPEDPNWFMHGPSERLTPPEPNPRQRERRKPVRDPLPESAHDWRRRHDEWQRQLPAPQLAARLEALQRAIANPAALITGAARRLRHDRATKISRARAAGPRLSPPKRAAHLATGGHVDDFVQRCHDVILTPDTS